MQLHFESRGCVPTKWIPAAKNLRTSFFTCRTSRGTLWKFPFKRWQEPRAATFGRLSGQHLIKNAAAEFCGELVPSTDTKTLSYSVLRYIASIASSPLWKIYYLYLFPKGCIFSNPRYQELGDWMRDNKVFGKQSIWHQYHGKFQL